MKKLIIILMSFYCIAGFSKNQCADLFKIQSVESEISKHIDALVFERLRIDNGFYVIVNQKKQANETFASSLKEIVKSDGKYLTEFKKRYSEKLNAFIVKTKAADKEKNQEISERKKIVDSQKFNPKKIFEIKEKAAINSAKFSRDAKNFLVVLNNRTAKIYNTKSKKVELVLEPKLNVDFADFSSDGRFLFSGNSDGPIKIYDTVSWKLIYEIKLKQFASSVQFSSNNKYIVLTTDKGFSTHFYDIMTGQIQFQINHSSSVYDTRMSNNGKYLAAISMDDFVSVYEVSTGKKLQSIQFAENVRSVEFSPDDRHIVTSCDDNMVRVYETDSGILNSEIRKNDWTGASRFSPDGAHILVRGLSSYKVEIFGTLSGEVDFSVEHKSTVASAEFSPDAQYIATTSTDNTTQIYDLVSRQVAYVIKHKDNGLTASFSSDSKLLITSDANQSVQVFDLYSSAIEVPQ